MLSVMRARLNLRQLCPSALLLSILLINHTPSFGQELVPEILNKLYSLDFKSAQEELGALTREYPENPNYWNLLASSIWLEILHEQEKLNLESYSEDRDSSTGLNDFVDELMETKLRSALARAIETGTKMLSDERRKVDGFYALGVAHGTLASFEAVVNKAYFKANGEGKKARKYHLQVLEIDPSYADARLMIGTYDYFLGSIPRFVRLLLGLMGVRGEGKESGIQQVVYAADLGKRVSTNAKMMLVVIYNREERYDRALSLLNELHEKYPRNFLMEMAKGSVYEKKKEWFNALKVYRSVLSKIESGENDYDRFYAEPVLFKIAETNIHGFEQEELDLDQAMQVFGQIVLSDGANVELKARSHLWMGKIWDSRNERVRALEEYEAVLGLDCAKEVKRAAKDYQQRPFND